jgi:hypothetical protein
MSTALVGRTVVIVFYLFALLAAPGPAAILPAALLTAVWLAGSTRDLVRARAAATGAVDGR